MIDEKKINQAAIECADEYYSVDLGMNRTELIMEIFTKGAQWALQEFEKSLWHDASEEPVMQDVYYIPCLIQDDLGFGVRHWNVVEKCWDDEDAIDYYCEMENIKRWCYIKDLLPKKGGEQ